MATRRIGDKCRWAPGTGWGRACRPGLRRAAWLRWSCSAAATRPWPPRSWWSPLSPAREEWDPGTAVDQCHPVPLHPSVRGTCFAVHNALGSKCRAKDEQHARHTARFRRAGAHHQVSLAVCNGQLALALRLTASPHNDHQCEAYAKSEQRHDANCDEEPVPPLEPAPARWQRLP